MVCYTWTYHSGIEILFTILSKMSPILMLFRGEASTRVSKVSPADCGPMGLENRIRAESGTKSI